MCVKCTEKNSSDSDEQTVVLPVKRQPKANPNIQSTGGPKKQKSDINFDNDSSSDEDKVCCYFLYYNDIISSVIYFYRYMILFVCL